MLNTAATLKTFFSGFNLPAYTEESIPDGVNLPYISYQLVEPEWDQEANYHCRIWYRKNRLGELIAKADEIAEAVGTMKKFEQPGGYLVLYPGTPLIQMMSDEYTQSAFLTFTIKAYHLPGD